MPGGVHSKLSEALEAVLIPLEKFAGDIRQNKGRRTSQRTWKDNNRNTMYMD